MTVWLLVPIVSYYLGFIDVILYNYDRFVLPMCFVLAIFGGLAFDRLLSSGTRARLGRAPRSPATFAYTLLYAGTVDVLMMRDSRYDVERWMARARRPRATLVGVSGLHEYLPRLDDFRLEDISDGRGAAAGASALRRAQRRLRARGAAGHGVGADDRGPRARRGRLSPGRPVPARARRGRGCPADTRISSGRARRRSCSARCATSTRRSRSSSANRCISDCRLQICRLAYCDAARRCCACSRKSSCAFSRCCLDLHGVAEIEIRLGDLIVGRPGRQTFAVGIAGDGEVHPVARHLIGEAPVDVGRPRTRRRRC